MIVRAAEPSDRDELVRMRVALWPDSTTDEAGQVLAAKPEQGAVLVAAAEKGHLVGFAEIALRGFADGCSTSPVAYLEGIWVDAEARRNGVGAKLVEEAANWAGFKGLSEFASDCELTNHVSQAFHAAVGFQEVQRSVCFRRALAPEST